MSNVSERDENCRKSLLEFSGKAIIVKEVPRKLLPPITNKKNKELLRKKSKNLNTPSASKGVQLHATRFTTQFQRERGESSGTLGSMQVCPKLPNFQKISWGGRSNKILRSHTGYPNMKRGSRDQIGPPREKSRNQRKCLWTKAGPQKMQEGQPCLAIFQGSVKSWWMKWNPGTQDGRWTLRTGHCPETLSGPESQGSGQGQTQAQPIPPHPSITMLTWQVSQN